MMADDPGRDLVPVKEVAADRQKHNVSAGITGARDASVTHQCYYLRKLNREELEDRCMQLIQENLSHKKNCNQQEEKIKRLAAKLLRLVNEHKRIDGTCHRDCIAKEEDYLQRIREVEQSNHILKERLNVAKKQLTSLTNLSVSGSKSCGRASTKSTPACRMGFPPEVVLPCLVYSNMSGKEQGKVVYPGERNMLKRGTDSDGDLIQISSPSSPSQQTAKISELRALNNHLEEEVSALQEEINIYQQNIDMLREQGKVRISELEEEVQMLRSDLSQGHCQNIAENVELICLRRSHKQVKAQAETLQAQKQALEHEIKQLKGRVDETNREKENVSKELKQERQKSIELQMGVQELASFKHTVRDLQEEIKELKRENATIKGNNERLLSSGFGREQTRPAVMQGESFQKRIGELEVSLNGELRSRRNLEEELQMEKSNLAQMKVEHQDLQAQFEMLQKRHEFLEQQFENLIKNHSRSDDVRRAWSQPQRRSSQFDPTREISNGIHLCNTNIEQNGLYDSALLDQAFESMDVKAVLLETSRELEKCRELLRIQTNLNNLYKSEIAGLNENLDEMRVQNVRCETLLSDRLGVQVPLRTISPCDTTDRSTLPSASETCFHGRRIEKMYSDIPEYLKGDVPFKQSLSATSAVVQRHSDGISLLKQGFFEIHIKRFVFHHEGLCNLQEKSPAIFLSWEFYGEDKTSTPVMVGPNAEFDCHYKYRIEINDVFMNYLAQYKVPVYLHMAQGTSRTIAMGILCFRHAIDHADAKVHDVVQFSGFHPEDMHTQFGLLEFWYHLHCSPQVMQLYTERLGCHASGSKICYIPPHVDADPRQGEESPPAAENIPKKAPPKPAPRSKVTTELQQVSSEPGSPSKGEEEERDNREEKDDKDSGDTEAVIEQVDEDEPDAANEKVTAEEANTPRSPEVEPTEENNHDEEPPTHVEVESEGAEAEGEGKANLSDEAEAEVSLTEEQKDCEKEEEEVKPEEQESTSNDDSALNFPTSTSEPRTCEFIEEPVGEASSWCSYVDESKETMEAYTLTLSWLEKISIEGRDLVNFNQGQLYHDHEESSSLKSENAKRDAEYSEKKSNTNEKGSFCGGNEMLKVLYQSKKCGASRNKDVGASSADNASIKVHKGTIEQVGEIYCSSRENCDKIAKGVSYTSGETVLKADELGLKALPHGMTKNKFEEKGKEEYEASGENSLYSKNNETTKPQKLHGGLPSKNRTKVFYASAGNVAMAVHSKYKQPTSVQNTELAGVKLQSLVEVKVPRSHITGEQNSMLLQIQPRTDKIATSDTPEEKCGSALIVADSYSVDNRNDNLNDTFTRGIDDTMVKAKGKSTEIGFKGSIEDTVRGASFIEHHVKSNLMLERTSHENIALLELNEPISCSRLNLPRACDVSCRSCEEMAKSESVSGQTISRAAHKSKNCSLPEVPNAGGSEEVERFPMYPQDTIMCGSGGTAVGREESSPTTVSSKRNVKHIGNGKSKIKPSSMLQESSQLRHTSDNLLDEENPDFTEQSQPGRKKGTQNVVGGSLQLRSSNYWNNVSNEPKDARTSRKVEPKQIVGMMKAIKESREKLLKQELTKIKSLLTRIESLQGTRPPRVNVKRHARNNHAVIARQSKTSAIVKVQEVSSLTSRTETHVKEVNSPKKPAPIVAQRNQPDDDKCIPSKNSFKRTFYPVLTSEAQIKESLAEVHEAPAQDRGSQVIVEIHSLTLLPRSTPIIDPDVKQLYVEFSFLDQRGEELETPVSLPKPLPKERICYNFRKVFHLDPETGKTERELLKAMARSKHKAENSISFVVVSEPPPEECDTKECEEVGSAFVSIPHIYKKGKDIIEQEVPVFGAKNTQEIVGHLTLTVIAARALQDILNSD